MATAEQQRSGNGEARLLRLATRASVGVATLLVIVKLFAWLQTDSVSLLASLLDSGLDALASLINLFAVRYALTPADTEHRFGHGKAEPLAALLQALLILGSCAFVITEAFSRLSTPRQLDAVSPAIAVMAFSIAITLALIALQRYVVKRTQSTAIRADSLHYQADLLTNSATLLALFLTGAGFALADPVFGLAIGIWLLVTTRDVLSEALDQLLDRELPEADRAAILDIAEEHCGSAGKCRLRTRRAGRTRHIQMHLALDGRITLREAMRITDTVKDGILARFPDSDVLVYPDPGGAPHRAGPDADPHSDPNPHMGTDNK